jgi:hypothetical protein
MLDFNTLQVVNSRIMEEYEKEKDLNVQMGMLNVTNIIVKMMFESVSQQLESV